MKLRDLLLTALDDLPTLESGAARVLRVLAQSHNSPVVRALVSLQAELIAARFETRVLFATAEAGPQTVLGRSGTSRHLTDVRCHDAHEVMVLSATTSWVGDCMRRDPSTRDSFEMHTLKSVQAANWAAASFDKLWSMGAPLVNAVEEPVSCAMSLAADLAGLPSEAAPVLQVLTRH